MNHINGCDSACGYGRSYFIFKPYVKQRTTLVFNDSSAQEEHICTFDNCVQLLMYMENNIFEVLINHVLHKKPIYNDLLVNHYSYIEAQIHGDLYIDKDVDKFMVHQSDIDGNPMLLYRLNDLNIPYQIFE